VNALAALPAPRILVVDDDADIREMISQQLVQAGFAVSAAASLAEVRETLARQPVDLIVLDLNLPDGDGVDLCRELRAAGRAEAVIMVTARGAPIDRVLGLELGADDYLTKPFEPRELLARIRNLLRRLGDEPDPSLNKRSARFGPWTLDLVQRRLVARDGRLIILSSAEYRLLERFVRHPHTVLSREDLLPDRRMLASSDRAIDLQISRLRAKLADDGDNLILTVRNEGYVLAADVVFG
jgi:two-component system OmpR family response regulator